MTFKPGSREILEIVLDAGRFDDISGFFREINHAFMADEDWTLGESLDGLDDLFYGNFGVFKRKPFVNLRWVGMEKSREDLGKAATKAWLVAKLDDPARFGTAKITERVEALERGEGPTYFEMIMAIIADHPETVRLLPG